MKAFQSRSPIYLIFKNNSDNLDRVELKLYISESNNYDQFVDFNYTLVKTKNPLQENVTFEISELIRSDNIFWERPEFKSTGDTVVYCYVKAQRYNANNSVIREDKFIFKVREGYANRGEQQIITNLLNANVYGFFQNGGSDTLIPTVSPFVDNMLARRFDFGISADKLYSYVPEDKSPQTFQILVAKTDYLMNDPNVIYFGTDYEYLSVRFDIGTVESTNTYGYIDELRGDNGQVYFLISVFIQNMVFASADRIEIWNAINEETAYDSVIEISNPVLNIGKVMHGDASSLVLQDSAVVSLVENSSKNPQVIFDRNKSFWQYKVVNSDLDQDNLLIKFASNLDATSAKSPIKNKGAYLNFGTDTKSHFYFDVDYLTDFCYEIFTISFLNKYGVMQDVFMTGRSNESVSASKTKYESNPMQNGRPQSFLAQQVVSRVRGFKEITLNTGFYREGANSIFEQLLFSEYILVNDEFVEITDNSFQKKTRKDDRLINYSFTFKYLNPEV